MLIFNYSSPGRRAISLNGYYQFLNKTILEHYLAEDGVRNVGNSLVIMVETLSRWTILVAMCHCKRHPSTFKYVCWKLLLIVEEKLSKSIIIICTDNQSCHIGLSFGIIGGRSFLDAVTVIRTRSRHFRHFRKRAWKPSLTQLC